MGSNSLTGAKRYAAPTSIHVSIAVTGIYLGSDNPSELEKKFFDSKVSLGVEITLPDGMPPVRASRESTVGTICKDIDDLLNSVSRLGVEVDEGV